MTIVLNIEDSSFTASNGKLDSSKRYIYKTSAGNAKFVLPIGKTIDLPLRGVVYEINGYKFVVGVSSNFTSTYIESTV